MNHFPTPRTIETRQVCRLQRVDVTQDDLDNLTDEDRELGIELGQGFRVKTVPIFRRRPALAPVRRPRPASVCSRRPRARAHRAAAHRAASSTAPPGDSDGPSDEPDPSDIGNGHQATRGEK